MHCVSMMVYWNLHYVLQKTVLHLRYYNRLLSTLPPKTKAAQEFVNCGKPGFVWVLFWERNMRGWMRDGSGGEGGGSMWEKDWKDLQPKQSYISSVLGAAWEPESSWERSGAWEKKLPPVVCTLLCLWDLYILLNGKNYIKNAGLCY